MKCIIYTTHPPVQFNIQSQEELLTPGVTRKIMRGISPCVAQEKLKSKKAQTETRGTSKEAVLEGDPKCTNLIEASMYDTKPVN